MRKTLNYPWGIHLGIFGGSVPPVLQSETKTWHFSHPFSDLVSKEKCLGLDKNAK